VKIILGKMLNRILLLFSLKISRVSKWIEPTEGGPYYSFPVNCQIPNLSFLAEQLFGIKEQGYLVEIGAFDGISFSNTSGFIIRNWESHLIEPVPQFYTLLHDRYAHMSNVHLYNFAISSDNKDAIINVSGSLSSIEEKMTKEYANTYWAQKDITQENLVIKCETLENFLNSLEAPKNFDLLVVDVEGAEEKVFSTFFDSEFRPKVMIVELSDHHPDLSIKRIEHFKLGIKILDAGYSICYKDSINTVFVQSEHLRIIFKGS
jgi:FkbM family methyltransferase